jgi:hypothetical protein
MLEESNSMLEQSNKETGHTAPFFIHLSLVDSDCDLSVAQYWFTLKFLFLISKIDAMDYVHELIRTQRVILCRTVLF